MDAQGLRIPRSLSPSLPAPSTALLHVPVPARLAAAPGAPSPRPFLPRSLRSLCPSLLPYNVPAQPLDRPARAARFLAWGLGASQATSPVSPRMRPAGAGAAAREGGGRAGSGGSPPAPEERGAGRRGAAAAGRRAAPGGCACVRVRHGDAGDAGDTHHGGGGRRRAARRCPGYRRLGAALQARPRARPIRHRLPRPGAPAPPVRAGTGGRDGRGSAERGHSKAEGWVGGGV